MKDDKLEEMKTQGTAGEEAESVSGTSEKQEAVSAKHADNAPTLKEVIREQAIEGEAPLSKNFTIRKILGGDILYTSTIRAQIGVFVLITAFVLAYISSRYSYQQKLIELDKLNKELQDAKYKALSSSSQLTEKSRESNVLNMLKAHKDTTLKIATQPPYIVNVPEE